MKTKKSAKNAMDDIRFGFLFDETPQNPALYRGVSCLLKGFLVFCATFGTVAGILNAFDITYNQLAVFAILLPLCFCLAGLHYNKLIFNLCYPVVFICFTATIIRNRTLANSGFQAFLAIMYEKYSAHFELSFLREAREANTNRYLTITVTAIFVSFVLALLINIAISTYMSTLWTILLTAPLLQIAIYIGLYPNPIYFVPLVFSYIAVGILGSFKHHNIPGNKKERETYRIIRKPHKRYHIYRTSGKAMFQTTAVFAVVSLVFLIAFYPIASGSVNANSAINKVKSTTDEYVKVFIQNGLMGFFDRYQSTGGLSEGRLGGVSSVRPDYQTDLTVTFAPYSYETVYLRSYVGKDYQGNSWGQMEEDSELSAFYKDEALSEDYVNFIAQLEVERLKDYKNDNGEFAMEGKMEIVNIDANPNFLYTPYYSVNNLDENFAIKNQIFTGSSPTGSRHTYTYYPAVTQIDELLYPTEDLYASKLSLDSDYLSFLASYSQYCHDTYTFVPENLHKPIQNVIDEIGYGSGIEDKINRVRKYFMSEYTYSTSPGTTPRNADFISYFLTDQNQGYCAHFASASTMILRYMGIPARYVEGYIIPLSTMSEEYIQSQDADYTDYLSGTSPIGETGVVEIEITDANAHAWVEVYSEGFGWVPVEVTPPSSDEEEYSDILNLFANLFSITPTGGRQTQNEIATEEVPSAVENVFASTNHLAIPMALLLLCIILFRPVLVLLQNILQYLKQRKAFKNGDYDIVLSYYYRRLFLCLLKYKLIPEPIPSGRRLTRDEKLSYVRTFAPQSLIPYLKEIFEAADEDATQNSDVSTGMDSIQYIHLLEKALYAKTGISREETLRFIQQTKEYIQKAKKEMKKK